MRGPVHERLKTRLRHAVAEGVCTQDSLGRAIGKTQTGVGKYLLGKGGALDVDEAAAALQHIGSSLVEFLAGMPPRTLSPTDKLVRSLEVRPELQALITDLLRVPKPRLGAVLELAYAGIRAAIGPRTTPPGGSASGTTPVRRTTAGRVPRR